MVCCVELLVSLTTRTTNLLCCLCFWKLMMDAATVFDVNGPFVSSSWTKKCQNVRFYRRFLQLSSAHCSCGDRFSMWENLPRNIRNLSTCWVHVCRLCRTIFVKISIHIVNETLLTNQWCKQACFLFIIRCLRHRTIDMKIELLTICIKAGVKFEPLICPIGQTSSHSTHQYYS